MSDFEFIDHINMADSKVCHKIEIIQEVERHPTKQWSITAEEFNIAPLTLATILTAKEKYKTKSLFWRWGHCSMPADEVCSAQGY